ncbi:hypothetical protein PR202_gb12017 [Eleusine coracana subsp. coracana]|uniref:Uncharacterized protein n=1 Tax=Eleusine coracana subsp. coracana TaxID=191504 RepID=A0AAV5ELP0_ELECO|nr:hypothetical protein PR202_gb12017 [Eleusine coracana subsp. coracana]
MAFAEKGKLRKITGVKTKELLLWLSVVAVYVSDASPTKVTFKTGTGLSDTFDATAFALRERKKSVQLLEEPGLPKGLLPLEDIQEFGYNRETEFMWLVQGKKVVSEVMAFAEKGKLRKITGVKTKELMLWLSVVEVYVTDASRERWPIRGCPDHSPLPE